MSIREFADDLAAGDEVEALGAQLAGIQTQLESLGASSAPQPMGHIFVPRQGAGVALPTGTARVNFRNGTLKHSELGTVLDDLVTIDDIVDTNPNVPPLQNLIFHSDTLTNVEVGGLSQEIYLSNIPIPESDFAEVKLEMLYPGEITMLVSTQRLPINLSAITINGQRHGEVSGTFDSMEAVPVAPFSLWETTSATYAESSVYTAVYDSATWTVDNTGGNALTAEIQAREDIHGSTAGEWRTIADDSIPSGDHSVFHVSERHKFQRARVTNDTASDAIAASVDLMEANP